MKAYQLNLDGKWGTNRKFKSDSFPLQASTKEEAIKEANSKMVSLGFKAGSWKVMEFDASLKDSNPNALVFGKATVKVHGGEVCF